MTTLQDALRRSKLVIIAAAILVSGCAATVQRQPVGEADVARAQPYGLAEPVRLFGDSVEFDQIRGMAQARMTALRARHEGELVPGMQIEQTALALSGGGADGAFGAGFLIGWTERGDRPTFDLVSGISTGGLTAPFAFLGPDYDQQLTEVYTTYETRDLLTPAVLSGLLGGAALTRSDGLRALIERYADDAMIAAIAEEYRRGRLLFIGTTNLDASRPVIWDIGRIASSGHPEAKRLIHDVMLASASIPVAFPPVLMPVEVDGETFDEMHVDGGATQQVTLFSPSISSADLDEEFGLDVNRILYVIINNKLQKPYKAVEYRLSAIASTSMTSLINGQGTGDLYRLFAVTQRDGINLNIASIPKSFDREPTEPFEPDYMQELFELGREYGLRGDAWQPFPPDFRPRRGKPVS